MTINRQARLSKRLDFIKSALNAAGFSVADQYLERFTELESAVNRQVTGCLTLGLLDQWLKQSLLTNSSFSFYNRIAERDSRIANLDQALNERDTHVSYLNEVLAERDGEITSLKQAQIEHDRRVVHLEQALIERNNQLTQINQANLEINARIIAIENSTLWKMTLPARRVLIGRPNLRMIFRRTAKLVWWAGTLQLSNRLREWKARDRLRDEAPHISPPTDDYCLAVPLSYSVDKFESAPCVAVVCHLYYVEMTEEFQRYLINIPFPFDLFITTDSEEKQSTIENHFVQWRQGKVEIRIAPNRGRDIAPKLITCRDVYDRYEFVLHIHTKKSPYYEWLGGWRSYLLETLLGSEKIVESIFESFKSDPQLGVIAPQHFGTVRDSIGWGWNFKNAKKFARRLNIKIARNGRIDFPSGSMFWARSAALRPLLDCNLSLDEFPSESAQKDGTLSHAIERLYFFVCERAGYRWIKLCVPSLGGQTERVKYVENQDELSSFIKATQYNLLGFRIFDLVRPLFLKSRTDAVDSERKLDRLAYEKFGNKTMDFPRFQQELRLHIERKESLIDFDENFYLNVHRDVATSVASGALSCGFIHYCLVGQDEDRTWSNYQLERKFSLPSNFPDGFTAPEHIRPSPQINIDLSRLPGSPEPFLLIFFSHLQEDLFFAGYTEFFKDFAQIFKRFPKIILSVENEKFDPRLATRYSDRIEVIHEKELDRIKFLPDLVVTFNSHLFIKAKRICNNPNRIIYYCQDFEAGFFPYGDDYIKAEKAIASSHNIIISTDLLRNFLTDRQLLAHQRTFTTSPKIEILDVPPEKTKRLFFYFRPESFNQRNLPQTLMEVVRDFCKKT